jgi:hypothetical protein
MDWWLNQVPPIGCNLLSTSWSPFDPNKIIMCIKFNVCNVLSNFWLRWDFIMSSSWLTWIDESVIVSGGLYALLQSTQLFGLPVLAPHSKAVDHLPRLQAYTMAKFGRHCNTW